MLVRRWAHELTFKSLEQCVADAGREALRLRPKLKRHRCRTAIVLKRLAMFEYSARMHLSWPLEFSEGKGRLLPNCAA